MQTSQSEKNSVLSYITDQNYRELTVPDEINLGIICSYFFSPAGIRAVFDGFPILSPGLSPGHFFLADNTDLARQETFISLK